jgi:YggT family protein
MIPALIYIIQAFTHLFLLVLLLRFWLPWLGADFRNPIAQGILRLTSPLVVPVRRIVPPIGRLDTATVIIAFGIQCLAILVILAVSGLAADIRQIAGTAGLDLALLSIQLFIFAIFIQIILGWIAPHSYNPATAIIAVLAEPVLRPFRRMIPPLGAIDISPVFPLILLGALSKLLIDLRPLPI